MSDAIERARARWIRVSAEILASDPNARAVPLTRGLFSVVDSEDHDVMLQHKWHARWDSRMGSFYAQRNGLLPNGARTTNRMHRQLMGEPEGAQVDHENHETLDNRRHNLRCATVPQNSMNRRKQDGCSSGFKGVSWNREKRKWQAYITENGRQRYLGYFLEATEAARAYNSAAMSRDPQFAYLNKIPDHAA